MKILHTKVPAQVAGDELTALLQQYRERPVLLLLSGGSALSLLDYVDHEVLTSQLTLSVLDERFDLRSGVNNCAQLKETAFFKAATLRGATYINTERAPKETLSEAASRYDDALMLWQAEHEDGVILATFGVGVEGHTAGIFPDSVELLETYTSIIAAITLEPQVHPYTERFTVTPHFIATSITAGIAFASGAEKCAIISKLQAKEGEVADLPALLWHKIPTFTLVTDCPN